MFLFKCTKKNKKSIIMAFCFMFISTIYFVFSNLIIVTTASIDKTILLKSNNDREFRVGDYANYHLIDKTFGDALITKKIGCVSGDHIESIGREIFCNGVSLGIAKEFSRNGIKLNSYKYSGLIPEGEVYLYGSNPDSYDSRYFGLVKVKDLKLLKPIF